MEEQFFAANFFLSVSLSGRSRHFLIGFGVCLCPSRSGRNRAKSCDFVVSKSAPS